MAPFKIHDMGSNGTLISVLRVLPLQAVFKE
jgi:hypothetical protein